MGYEGHPLETIFCVLGGLVIIFVLIPVMNRLGETRIWRWVVDKIIDPLLTKMGV